MRFHELDLPGAFLVEAERLEDERGFFARTWCQRAFEGRGLDHRLVQCSVSFNERAGTLRGMHYQAAPHEETKLVRCTRGAIFDVVIDLRPWSPAFKRWLSVELTAENHRALYIPGGLAHGFQTLDDRTEVFYQMTDFYEPGSARGVRWDDPAFGIAWPPAAARIISEKDRAYPDFR